MHMHLFPPLPRPATVKKPIVPCEVPGEPQRDVAREAGAARLRGLPVTRLRGGAA